MFWKDMEVPFEVKPEQKPCGKENFDTKWRMTVHKEGQGSSTIKFCPQNRQLAAGGGGGMRG